MKVTRFSECRITCPIGCDTPRGLIQGEHISFVDIKCLPVPHGVPIQLRIKACASGI